MTNLIGPLRVAEGVSRRCAGSSTGDEFGGGSGGGDGGRRSATGPANGVGHDKDEERAQVSLQAGGRVQSLLVWPTCCSYSFMEVKEKMITAVRPR